MLLAICFCFGASMFSIALIARMWVSAINLAGLAAGCVFACANIFFYRLVVPGVLQWPGISHAWLLMAVLLKMPVLILLLVLLVQQSPSFIGNAVAGSLAFVPAAFITALILRRRFGAGEEAEGDTVHDRLSGDQNSGL